MSTTIPTIKLPTPASVKIHKKLDLFAEETIIKSWSGSCLTQSFVYYYLFHKYKNNCFIMSRISPKSKISTPEIIMHVGNKAHRAKWPAVSNYALNVFRCISRNTSDAFVIPLGLIMPRSGHANLLIYRKRGNVIEHFEPHGAHFTKMRNGELIDMKEINKAINANLDELVKQINTHLRNDSKPEVTLVRSDVVCPNLKGLQVLESTATMKKLTIEGGGYCAAWSMFFTEMVMKNPSISSAELMRIILGYKSNGSLTHLDIPTDYFRRIIIGYVNVIHERIEKYYSFISGNKKITIDEIGAIVHRTGESIEVFDNYEAITNINNFILNNPTSTKETYIAQLETINKTNPTPLNTRIIHILNRIDEKFLNPSITPPTYRSPTPITHKNKMVPPNTTRRCPNGFHRDPKTKNCVKKPDTKIVNHPENHPEKPNNKVAERCPPGTRKRKLLKNEPAGTIRACIPYTK